MRQHFEALRDASANHVPLSPLPFLRRAGSLHGARMAVILGDIRRNWSETSSRQNCRTMNGAHCRTNSILYIKRFLRVFPPKSSIATL